MIYATFNHPNAGYKIDQELAQVQGLKVGETYPVKDIHMYNFYTYIYLEGFSGSFNSVLFDFSENIFTPEGKNKYYVKS